MNDVLEHMVQIGYQIQRLIVVDLQNHACMWYIHTVEPLYKGQVVQWSLSTRDKLGIIMGQSLGEMLSSSWRYYHYSYYGRGILCSEVVLFSEVHRAIKGF